ncbi:DUF4225 domain-containing protein [Buttiauxella agrestis]|uniref:DUF4225 domain-containing protein n=1 Tax=Buttiauxella agrestis TaxID=82977 RepID=UPI0015600642|nr:DUF4225 domain-containing protein [Buttiauxella agrestis]BCG08269.1 DUF4225 domain-containing protein [Buttiauxella agrestis]
MTDARFLSEIENSFSFQTLHRLSLQLKNLGEHVARNYLRQSYIKRRFLAEVQQLISQSETAFVEGRISLNAATYVLQQEYNYLKKSSDDLFAQRVQQWIIIEAEKEAETERNGWKTLVIKQIGFVGGGTQIIAGYGACAGTLGLGCAAFGGTLIAHGTNNMYENGYYLLYRKEKVGYVKQVYQIVAKEAGFTEKQGENAFAVVDLGLSVNGLLTKVNKPEAWRLFRYMNQDKIYAFKKMTPSELTIEISSDSATIAGLEKE